MDNATAHALKPGTPVEHHALGPATWVAASRMDGPTAAWITLDGQTRRTLVDFTQVKLTTVETASQGWDWQGQIDLDALAKDLERLSGGKIRLYQPDTGGEDYGYVLATGELTDDEIRIAYYGPDDPDAKPVFYS